MLLQNKTKIQYSAKPQMTSADTTYIIRVYDHITLCYTHDVTSHLFPIAIPTYSHSFFCCI